MNIIVKRLMIALVTSLVALPAWAILDQRIKHEITVQCEQLVMDYAVYRDHLDADGFANVFTNDAQLLVGGGEYIGTAAFRKYITDHEPPAKAHMIMITSSEVIPLSETEAKGVFYAIVLGSNQHVGPGDPPVQTKGIGAANEYQVDFELTQSGWKIARLSLVGLFTGPR